MARNPNHTLKHFGVKGMKWGKTTAREDSSSSSSSSSGSSSSGGSSAPAASADVAAISRTQAKIAKGGTGTVSDKEMKALVNRMNLEQQYTKLTTPEISDGQKMAANMVGSLGKTVIANTIGAKEPKADPKAGTELEVFNADAAKAAKRAAGKQVATALVMTAGAALAKEYGPQLLSMAAKAAVKAALSK